MNGTRRKYCDSCKWKTTHFVAFKNHAVEVIVCSGCERTEVKASVAKGKNARSKKD